MPRLTLLPQSVASHLVATRPASLTHHHQQQQPASPSPSGARGSLSPGALMQVGRTSSVLWHLTRAPWPRVAGTCSADGRMCAVVTSYR